MRSNVTSSLHKIELIYYFKKQINVIQCSLVDCLIMHKKIQKNNIIDTFLQFIALLKTQA